MFKFWWGFEYVAVVTFLLKCTVRKKNYNNQHCCGTYNMLHVCVSFHFVKIIFKYQFLKKTTFHNDMCTCIVVWFKQFKLNKKCVEMSQRDSAVLQLVKIVWLQIRADPTLPPQWTGSENTFCILVLIWWFAQQKHRCRNTKSLFFSFSILALLIDVSLKPTLMLIPNRCCTSSTSPVEPLSCPPLVAMVTRCDVFPVRPLPQRSRSPRWLLRMCVFF